MVIENRFFFVFGGKFADFRNFTWISENGTISDLRKEGKKKIAKTGTRCANNKKRLRPRPSEIFLRKIL